MLLHNKDLGMLAEMNGLAYTVLKKVHVHAKTVVAGKHRGVVIDHRKSADTITVHIN